MSISDIYITLEVILVIGHLFPTFLAAHKYKKEDEKRKYVLSRMVLLWSVLFLLLGITGIYGRFIMGNNIPLPFCCYIPVILTIGYTYQALKHWVKKEDLNP